MTPPIPGMKQSPWMIDDPTGIMGGAWYGLVLYAYGEDALAERFKAETGHDIRSVGSARGLDAMIDEATGHRLAVIAAFADWVTVNLWGDGSDPDTPSASPVRLDDAGETR